MLKRKTLRKYTEKRFELMQKHLCKYTDKNTQEDLHQFRVETKKLKAFIGLVQYINADEKIHKEFKPIGKLFDHAGKIRSAHIELLLIKRYRLKNPAYSKALQDIIRSESARLKKKKEHYLNALKESSKKIDEHITKLGRTELTEYTHQQLKMLSKYFAAPQNIAGIHKSRILLKKLFYNYSLFDSETQKKLNLDIKYLNTLQEKIGNWHDMTVTIESLSSNMHVQKSMIGKLRIQERKLLAVVKSDVKDFSKKVNMPLKNHGGKHVHSKTK
ncbi:MAG: CHAD domain-containing protein [Bacteroidetes bacterium]|nr:CHAD domain-containing protein [Bacteroidota bacterium]